MKKIVRNIPQVFFSDNAAILVGLSNFMEFTTTKWKKKSWRPLMGLSAVKINLSDTMVRIETCNDN